MAPQDSIVVGLGQGARLSHDSGAALLVDGRLVAACDEERFSRVKHDPAFPERSIAYCLGEAGVRPEDVGWVAIAAHPWVATASRLRFLLAGPGTPGWRARWLASLVASPYRARARARRRFPAARVVFVEHHLAHAASAFLCSPFEHAAILTLDGRGEWATAVLAEGRGAGIRKLAEAPYPHSAGILYLALTEYLGFRYGDEYKVMGLASYGEPKWLDDAREALRSDPLQVLRLDRRFYVNPHQLGDKRAGRYGPAFRERFGPPREPEGPIESRHHDLARSFQARLEEIGLETARALLERTGCRRLVMAGGVCLNGAMNEAIREGLGLDEGDLFIQPAASDSGLSLGSALWVEHVVRGRPRRFVMEHAFWGPAHDEREVLAACRSHGVEGRPVESPADVAAGLVAEDRVVAWFQGRAEYGPRALGHRSILADPRVAANRDRVNASVKHREAFRPFAPSVLAEDAATYFENLSDSPFMLRIARVRPEKRSAIPAVVHVDGTARPQTVTRDADPLYHALLRRFRSLTGESCVLNTSFNRRGEPIVNSPADALGCFLATDLDALLMGRILVTRPGRG